MYFFCHIIHKEKSCHRLRETLALLDIICNMDVLTFHINKQNVFPRKLCYPHPSVFQSVHLKTLERSVA